MRQIKFRVWCKRTRHFTDIPFYSCGGRQLLWHHTGDEFSLTNLDDESEYVFQQFTGLKDKNGVAIFEGDILKHDIGLGPIYWRVVWDIKVGKWKINKENGGNTGNWFCNYEVAGNIFENPELLS